MEPSKTIILFTITYAPFKGGAEIAIEEITKRLPDYRFIVVTARLRHGTPRIEFQRENVEIRRVGVPGYFNIVSKNLYIVFAVAWTLRFAIKNKIDVLWGFLESYAAIAAGITKFFLRKSHYILTLQSGDSNEFWKRRVGWWKFVFKYFYQWADHITAISQWLVTRVRDQFGYRGPVTQIPNGIKDFFFEWVPDEEKADIRDTTYEIRKNEEKVILSVSRLEYKNGVDILIRAFAMVVKKTPEARLVLIGSGREEQMLKALVRSLSLESRVIFLGDIPNGELPKYYQSSDVFCRASRTEGQGISFFEAFASRIPVVATDAGGLKEFLHHHETGYVSRTEDPQDLAEKLLEALTEGGTRNRVTENAARFAQAYRWNSLADQYRTVIETTMRTPANRPIPAVRQFMKYGIVGGSAAVIDFIIFTLLTGIFHAHYLSANICSVVIAGIYNFLLSRHWTFRSRSKTPLKQFVAYGVSITIYLFLSSLLLAALIEMIGLHSILAKILTASIMWMWNYFIARTIVFRYF